MQFFCSNRHGELRLHQNSTIFQYRINADPQFIKITSTSYFPDDSEHGIVISALDLQLYP